MLSPDSSAAKRTSIRLTLKTSVLASQPTTSQLSPELTSPPGHRRLTRRSTGNYSTSEDDFKFSMPTMSHHLGTWEQVLWEKFSKSRKIKEAESAASAVDNTLATVKESATPTVDGVELTSPTGESAREHAIKLVLSGHLRLENQSDSQKNKCVSRKRSLNVNRSHQQDMGSSYINSSEEPVEGYLKPVNPEFVTSPSAPVKLKLSKPQAISLELDAKELEPGELRASTPETAEEHEMQQQWNSAQRRIAANPQTPSSSMVAPTTPVVKSPTTEMTPTSAARQLQTYEDVF